MSTVHGSKAKVYLGGYDISTYLTDFSDSAEVDVADSSTLGNTWKENVAGLVQATASFEGVFDGGTEEIDELIQAYLDDETSTAIFSYLPQGDTLFNRFVGIRGNINGYSSESSITDVGRISGEVISNFGIDNGVILHALEAEGAGGNETSLDQAAGSTNGAVGYLQATTGSSLVVKVQHSTNNSTWADLITFSSLSARGVERVAVSGTVNRYVRCLWTGTGTFAVGFSRK